MRSRRYPAGEVVTGTGQRAATRRFARAVLGAVGPVTAEQLTNVVVQTLADPQRSGR